MYDIINAMRNDAKIVKHSPRLYITSNGAYVVAYDPKENDWYENSIDLLWKDFEFFTPLAGIEKNTVHTRSRGRCQVCRTDGEAYLTTFAAITIYATLRQFTRSTCSCRVYCFVSFAEDTGLFPEENLFTNTLKTHTKEDGSDLSEFIDRAFLAMSTNDTVVLDTPARALQGVSIRQRRPFQKALPDSPPFATRTHIDTQLR